MHNINMDIRFTRDEDGSGRLANRLVRTLAQIDRLLKAEVRRSMTERVGDRAFHGVGFNIVVASTRCVDLTLHNTIVRGAQLVPEGQPPERCHIHAAGRAYRQSYM